MDFLWLYLVLLSYLSLIIHVLIISYSLNIINKLKEDSVKGVKTTEFKEWVNSLEEHSDSEYFKVFKELKDGINKIPDEITKKNIEESYQIVFNTLNNFKVNK